MDLRASLMPNARTGEATPDLEMTEMGGPPSDPALSESTSTSTATQDPSIEEDLFSELSQVLKYCETTFNKLPTDEHHMVLLVDAKKSFDELCNDPAERPSAFSPNQVLPKAQKRLARCRFLGFLVWMFLLIMGLVLVGESDTTWEPPTPVWFNVVAGIALMVLSFMILTLAKVDLDAPIARLGWCEACVLGAKRLKTESMFDQRQYLTDMHGMLADFATTDATSGGALTAETHTHMLPMYKLPKLFEDEDAFWSEGVAKTGSELRCDTLCAARSDAPTYEPYARKTDGQKVGREIFVLACLRVCVPWCLHMSPLRLMWDNGSEDDKEPKFAVSALEARRLLYVFDSLPRDDHETIEMECLSLAVATCSMVQTPTEVSQLLRRIRGSESRIDFVEFLAILCAVALVDCSIDKNLSSTRLLPRVIAKASRESSFHVCNAVIRMSKVTFQHFSESPTIGATIESAGTENAPPTPSESVEAMAKAMAVWLLPSSYDGSLDDETSRIVERLTKSLDGADETLSGVTSTDFTLAVLTEWGKLVSLDGLVAHIRNVPPNTHTISFDELLEQTTTLQTLLEHERLELTKQLKMDPLSKRVDILDWLAFTVRHDISAPAQGDESEWKSLYKRVQDASVGDYVDVSLEYTVDVLTYGDTWFAWIFFVSSGLLFLCWPFVFAVLPLVAVVQAIVECVKSPATVAPRLKQLCLLPFKALLYAAQAALVCFGALVMVAALSPPWLLFATGCIEQLELMGPIDEENRIPVFVFMSPLLLYVFTLITMMVGDEDDNAVPAMLLHLNYFKLRSTTDSLRPPGSPRPNGDDGTIKVSADNLYNAATTEARKLSDFFVLNDDNPVHFVTAELLIFGSMGGLAAYVLGAGNDDDDQLPAFVDLSRTSVGDSLKSLVSVSHVLVLIWFGLFFNVLLFYGAKSMNFFLAVRGPMKFFNRSAEDFGLFSLSDPENVVSWLRARDARLGDNRRQKDRVTAAAVVGLAWAVVSGGYYAYLRYLSYGGSHDAVYRVCQVFAALSSLVCIVQLLSLEVANNPIIEQKEVLQSQLEKITRESAVAISTGDRQATQRQRACEAISVDIDVFAHSPEKRLFYLFGIPVNVLVRIVAPALLSQGLPAVIGVLQRLVTNDGGGIVSACQPVTEFHTICSHTEAIQAADNVRLACCPLDDEISACELPPTCSGVCGETFKSWHGSSCFVRLFSGAPYAQQEFDKFAVRCTVEDTCLVDQIMMGLEGVCYHTLNDDVGEAMGLTTVSSGQDLGVLCSRPLTQPCTWNGAFEVTSGGNLTVANIKLTRPTLPPGERMVSVSTPEPTRWVCRDYLDSDTAACTSSSDDNCRCTHTVGNHYKGSDHAERFAGCGGCYCCAPFFDGALLVSGGSVKLQHVVVDGNSRWAAIYVNMGRIVLADSTVTGNTVGQASVYIIGDAVDPANVIITRCEFHSSGIQWACGEQAQPGGLRVFSAKVDAVKPTNADELQWETATGVFAATAFERSQCASKNCDPPDDLGTVYKHTLNDGVYLYACGEGAGKGWRIGADPCRMNANTPWYSGGVSHPSPALSTDWYVYQHGDWKSTGGALSVQDLAQSCGYNTSELVALEGPTINSLQPLGAGNEQCDSYDLCTKSFCEECAAIGGVSHGNRVCCAGTCGSCGGDGCDERDGGASACCEGHITDKGETCGTPPCLLQEDLFQGNNCPATGDNNCQTSSAATTCPPVTMPMLIVITALLYSQDFHQSSIRKSQ